MQASASQKPSRSRLGAAKGVGEREANSCGSVGGSSVTPLIESHTMPAMPQGGVERRKRSAFRLAIRPSQLPEQ